MSREVLMLADALAREKNVEPEVVFGALEAALAHATKKRLTEDAEVRVEIDRKTGEYAAFRRWEVLPDDAEIEAEDRQLTLTQAQERVPGSPTGRIRRGAPGSGGIRPHRRPGREAGHPPAHPRRRA
jgi:N utilization substance protein A